MFRPYDHLQVEIHTSEIRSPPGARGQIMYQEKNVQSNTVEIYFQTRHKHGFSSYMTNAL
jgi:hypothetical protein